MSRLIRVVLASRLKAAPTAENFYAKEFDLHEARDGEVTLQVLYHSLGLYMHGCMSEAKSYAAPTRIAGIMEGEKDCEVATSRALDFNPHMGSVPTSVSEFTRATVRRLN